MREPKKEEWYCCPECGQKILKIRRDARARGLLIKCKRCRKIIEIRVEPMSQ